MKVPSTLLVLVASSVVTGAVSAHTLTSADAFKEYVESKKTEIVVLKEAGRIDSPESNVVVLAILARNSSHKVNAMRGVRLELSNRKNASETIYIPEDYVEALAQTISRLDREVTLIDSVNLREGEQRTNGCQGAAEFCCNPQPPYDVFRVDYCQGDHWSGFTLVFTQGDAHRKFQFPGYRPGEFGEVLNRALVILENR